MGGSQLTQLKSTLRSSGLSRTSNPKDPKKKSKQRKDLSATSLAHRNQKLDDIGKGFNQFDLRQEKRKFDVVTRQGKLEEGKQGAPTKSRTAGVELRKKTLLPMLQSRTHTSSFVDRRFGEASSHLTPEEKALERFTAERQSRLGGSKKSRFNLEDDEGEEGEEEEGLTHGGRKLGFGDEEELEHGGWGGLGAAVEGGASASNREPLLRRRMAEGKAEEEEEQPERKRTKAEIMEEVMVKSKTHKYERQKIRSADDETRHALDAELKDLRTLLGGTGRMPRPAEVPAEASSSKMEVDGSNDDEEEEDGSDEEEDDDDDDEEEGSDEEGSTYELNEEELEAALAAAGKPGVDRELLRKLIGDNDSSDDEEAPRQSTGPAPTFELDDSIPRPAAAVAAEKEADPYDQYVRLLALEPRAKPSDRMKTPLELAQEAAEELRKREEKRLKRQRGEEGDSDDEEGNEGKGKKSKKEGKKRAPQGDDLEDDYFGEEVSEGEEEEGLGKGLEGGFGGQVIEDVSEEGEEEGSDEEEEEGSDEEEEEESDEDLAAGLDDSDSEDDELKGTALESLVKPLTAEEDAPTQRTWGGKDVQPELPFTFPCPTTHAEFVKLLRSSGIKEEETATVVKRIRVLYHPGLGESNKEKLQTFHNVLLDHILHLASHPSPTTFTTINSLLPHLLTLSHAYPLAIAPYYLTKLTLMQSNFIRAVSSGPLDPTSPTWPGAAELTLLRLVGIVWSTSDLSHPVAAAALLLIGQYLAQSRLRSLADISAGLFLCTLASQYEEKSRRIVPEALNFLLNATAILLPTTSNTFTSAKSLPGSFPAPDFNQEHTKALKLKSKDSLEAVEPSKRMDFLGSVGGGAKKKEEQIQLKVDLVKMTLDLMLEQAERQVSVEAFDEMYKPAEALLSKVSTKNLPTATKAHLTSLLTSLRRMLKLSLSTRTPLAMQQHKPIPIATYIPKFDEGYNPNRRFDPDTERAEQSKIKALYKKEKKGAIRELRKDNRFLAAEEVKRKAESDAVYNKKIAKIMGSLEDERAEEKQHQRAKDKGKKQDKARSARK